MIYSLKKHFYIQYNGGQEKNHFEIKTEKSKMLVTIVPQTHGEQSFFFFFTFDKRIFLNLKFLNLDGVRGRRASLVAQW